MFARNIGRIIITTVFTLLLAGMFTNRVFASAHISFISWYPENPFQKAVFRGDYSTVRAMLDKNPALADGEGTGDGSPLFFAIQANNVPMIELFLSRGADLKKGTADYTPLVFAIETYKADAFICLAEHDPNFSEEVKKQSLIFKIASKKTVFRSGTQVQYYNECKFLDRQLLLAGITPLYIDVEKLIEYQFLKCIEFYYLPTIPGAWDSALEAHPELRKVMDLLPATMACYLAEASRNRGSESIHLSRCIEEYACERNLIEMLSYLKSRNFNINTANESGKTPLYVSIENGNNLLACDLINTGARLDTQDNGGWTLLHIASYTGAIEPTKLLIKKGLAKNAKNNYGETPLHTIVKENWYWPRWSYRNRLNLPGVAELLIEKGADINARDNEGKTPLYYAERNELDMISAMLKKHGATK